MDGAPGRSLWGCVEKATTWLVGMGTLLHDAICTPVDEQVNNMKQGLEDHTAKKGLMDAKNIQDSTAATTSSTLTPHTQETGFKRQETGFKRQHVDDSVAQVPRKISCFDASDTGLDQKDFEASPWVQDFLAIMFLVKNQTIIVGSCTYRNGRRYSDNSRANEYQLTFKTSEEDIKPPEFYVGEELEHWFTEADIAYICDPQRATESEPLSEFAWCGRDVHVVQ